MPRSPHKLSIWVSLAWLAFTASARAQPVNAEAVLADPFVEGWSGSAEASFSMSRGNVELLDVGGSGRGQYQTLYPKLDEQRPPFLRQRMMLTANGRFAEREDTTFIDQGFAHLRWTGMWLRRVGSEAFLQYQFNEFQRLLTRAVAGAGLRFDLIHERPFLLWGGSAAMFEFERIDVQAGAPDDPETTAYRWSNFLTARVPLPDRMILQNTVFYQPRFDAFGDYRVLDELTLKLQANDTFSLGMMLSLLHDSRPPTGVEETDLTLSSTLGVSF